MKSFTEIGVTGISVLDTRREKKSGKFPVKFRVLFQRKAVYYRANIDLTNDEWLSVTDPKHKSHNTMFSKRMRKNIDDGLSSIQEHVRTLSENQDGFTFERLNARMGRAIKNDILNTFDQIIDENIQMGKLNTSDWYKYSKKSIEKFSPEKCLSFKNVTIDWLKNYEKYLFNEGKSVTTISMYMRALQRVMNDGVKQGYIKASDYPFGVGKNRYKIPKVKTRKIALNLAQIEMILNYEPNTKNESFLRDLWVFSYLCNGANVTDLLKLKYSNIEGPEIAFYRQKTSRKQDKSKVRAVILPEMKQIIERWGNEKKLENYIFPVLKDGLTLEKELLAVKNFTTLINKKMNRIGLSLGIGKISTYTARHSFATVMKRSGASIEYISESLGHSNVKMTETYLANFEIETRIKNAANLLNFDKDETN